MVNESNKQEYINLLYFIINLGWTIFLLKLVSLICKLCVNQSIKLSLLIYLKYLNHNKWK